MSQEVELKIPVVTYGRDQVIEIINSVLLKMQQPQTLSNDTVSHELSALKEAIVDLRQQLHAAQPTTLGQADIPTAKDELDAVVGATERATTTIMDACEKILAQMEKADPLLLQMTEAEVVKIYEACTFQDITGQRIAKVIKTLKKIDDQISALLGTLDSQLDAATHPSAQNPGQAEAASLLNGPQLPQNAMSQEEIDKILSAFE